MKPNYLITVLLWTLCSLSTVAQITFSPEKPQKGQTVTFTYSPKGTLLESDTAIKCYATFYKWNPSSNGLKPVSLTRQGDRWLGELSLTDTTAVVALAFLAGNKVDHNSNRLYSLFVYSSSDKPVQYARSGLALIYSGLAMHQVGARTILDELVSLYRQEIADYPQSKRKYTLSVLNAVLFQKKDGYRKRVTEELESYISDNRELTLDEMKIVVDLYWQIGNKGKADLYRKRIAWQEPKGFAAQYERAKVFEKEMDWRKKRQLFYEFERDFGGVKAEGVSDLANSIAVDCLEHDEIDSLKQFMAERPEYFNDPETLNNLAWKMAEAGKALPFAEELSRKSLKNLKEQKQPENHYMPLWENWEDTKHLSYRVFQDTYGYILEQQGRHKEAYAAYKEALDPALENISPEYNERYILCAIKTGHTREAKIDGERFIRAGKDTPKLREAIRSLYVQQGGTTQQAGRYIADLQAKIKAEQEEEILKSLISEPAPAFSLNDLNGNRVNLADLKGKIVVLDFWATWCGPCVASFPAMQQAQNKFAQNPNVKFLFINTSEGEGDGDKLIKKVSSFIQKKQYNFTVPMDLEKTVRAAYKVEGIPAKFIIDGQGNIRYRSTGFSGDAERTVDEISQVVELLSTK